MCYTQKMNYKTLDGRLREDGARQILADRAKGDTYRTIANKMDVSLGTVYNICTGRTWTHIKKELEGAT